MENNENKNFNEWLNQFPEVPKAEPIEIDEDEECEAYGWECPENIPDINCIAIEQQRWCICTHYSDQPKDEYIKHHHRIYYGRDFDALLYFAIEDYRSAFFGNDWGRITVEFDTDNDVLICTERHCNGSNYYWFEPEEDNDKLYIECKGKKNLLCKDKIHCEK